MTKFLDQFDIEKQKDGTFLYKAKEGFTASAAKITKAQYKERPQYPLIEKIEVESKEKYNSILKETTIEIVKFIKKL